MSLLSDALAQHASRLIESAGECVTYTRGSDSVDVMAVIGGSDLEIEQRDGSVIQFRSIDFLIRISDLELNGELTTPARSDLITYAGKVYRVLPEPGLPHYRAATGYASSMYRIHTKLK